MTTEEMLNSLSNEQLEELEGEYNFQATAMASGFANPNALYQDININDFNEFVARYFEIINGGVSC